MSQPTVTSQQPPSYGPPTGPPPTAAGSPPPSSPPRRRLRDRLFGLRSVLAVGLAGVIIGGGAGAGIMALAGSGSDGQRGPDRHFPGGPWVRPGPFGGFGQSGHSGQGTSQRTPAF